MYIYVYGSVYVNMHTYMNESERKINHVRSAIVTLNTSCNIL